MTDAEIQTCITNWYGLPLPITIQTREQDIHRFQTENEYIPSFCHAYINHNVRLVHLCTRPSRCVDLIVRYEGRLSLVQDICFKDTFSSISAQHMAIKCLLDNSHEVFVVYHQD